MNRDMIVFKCFDKNCKSNIYFQNAHRNHIPWEIRNNEFETKYLSHSLKDIYHWIKVWKRLKLTKEETREEEDKNFEKATIFTHFWTT